MSADILKDLTRKEKAFLLLALKVRSGEIVAEDDKFYLVGHDGARKLLG
ncbi:hypothetical protein KAR91_61770 [Candidatus Pacearchaeota archaeon]|nr:hypothetical protein [Candidatus Pacearchaeota archaeon]